MNLHPVVKKYDLKTYTSKYDNQRCAVSGKDTPKGTLIANVASLMSILNTLGMISTKVFKYAQVEMLPMLATARETELVRKAAKRLLSLTDPKWPKDYVGCSASSFHPVNNWVGTDCHELGTQRAANALLQHVGTQIDKDSDEAKAIKKVAARKWTPEVAPEAPVEEDVVCDEGYIVRETRRRGEVFVDALSSTVATVTLDPPWTSTYHATVKDAVKGAGAKWNPSSKEWTLSFRALAEVLVTYPKVTVTPDALKALRNLVDAEEQNETTDVMVNGRKARVQTSPSRKRGEVLLDLNGSGLKVMFDFPKTDRMLRLKDDVKRLSGRWNKDDKCWVLGTNAVVENIESLFEDLPLVLTEAALQAMTDVMERRSLSAAMDLSDDELKKAINDAVPAGKTLFPFQTAGVAFLEKAGGCGLVGDEMGTGKTIQTAAFLDYRPDLRPAVVVVPAVVATNWVNELEDWTEGESIYRLKNGKDEAPEGTTIVVVTYDLVKQTLTKEEKEDGKQMGARDAIKAMNPKCVVADECHYLKNEKAQRTVACKDLAHHDSVESVVLLSGTPVVNRPKEFFNALNMLRPEEFSSWFKYTERYCDGHRDEWDRYQCNGVSNTEELASKLKDVMIRRLKKDVLEELPAKMRGRVTVDITPKTRAAYNRAMKNADTPLTQLTAGRYALGLAKVAPAVEMAKDYADQNKPLLVFAHHREVMDGLCDGLSNAGISYGRIDGTVSVERRGELVDSFQAGNLDTMVLSVKAAGVGITLTRSSDVLFVERAWTPADEEQAEDRAHRIGQTGSVTVRYLVATNTMDEDMDALIESKRSVLEAVLNQGKLLPEDLDVRKDLLAAVAKRVVGKRKKGGKRNVRKRA
jgi:SWI/SNF-related matrix-associated actin-dependent regulator 1 of chromatin subfamily A